MWKIKSYNAAHSRDVSFRLSRLHVPHPRVVLLSTEGRDLPSCLDLRFVWHYFPDRTVCVSDDLDHLCSTDKLTDIIAPPKRCIDHLMSHCYIGDSIHIEILISIKIQLSTLLVARDLRAMFSGWWSQAAGHI